MNNTNKWNLVVFMSIAIGLSSCGENKSAATYIEDGHVLLQKKEYSKAIIQLKNAVKMAPQDVKARVLLGTAYLTLGNYISAEKELAKAVELGIGLEEIAEPLIQAMSKMNEFEDVYDFVDEAGALNEKQYVTVLTFAGITAINQNDKTKAIDYLQQAISLKTGSPYSTLAEGYLNYINKKYTESVAISQKLIIDHPLVTEALILKGYASMELKDFGNASRSFANYISYHPQAHYVKLLEINGLVGSGDLDTAEAKIDKILKIFEEAPLAKQLKSQIAFLNKDYSTAIEFSEKAINSGLDYQFTRLIAGVSAYKLARYEAAYQHLNTYADNLSADSDLKRLFTFLQLKLGYEEDALQNVEQFDVLSELDGNLYAETAMQLARSGDITKAKQLLSKANEIEDNNAINLLREGMLKLQTSDISGITELEAAIKNDDRVNSAWLTIALAHLQNNDLPQALASAEKWQLVSPEDGLALKGVIYFHVNQIDKAIEVLNEALVVNPEHIGAQMNLIRASMRNKDNKTAMQTAKNILTTRPDHIKSMVIIISLLRAENKIEEAKKFIQGQIKAHPSLLSPKIAMAIIHRHDNQVEKAIELLVPEKNRLNSVGWKVLGNSQLYARQFDEALETFTQWKESEPASAESWLKIIAILDLLKKNEEAYNTVKSAELVFADHPQLLMLRLYYQTQLGFTSEANKTLLTIKKAGIEDPLLARLEGELALASHDFEAAEELLFSYYEVAPSMESAALFADVLKSKEQVIQAGDLLESEFERGKKSFKGLFILAKFFSSTQQYQKSNTYYAKVLEYRPENIIALNNLASNMLKINNLKVANEYAEKAFKVAPDMSAVLDTIGWVKVQLGENDTGLNYLKKAYRLDPNSPEIRAHYERAKELVAR
jgi:putative PEP-CTERM system TPR-repeat lipoprotein